MFKTKIIEIFGLPRTGKTTIANAIKKYLRNAGYNIDIVKERAAACPLTNKLHPTFNYWTSISLFKEYLEANDKDIDFIIADRGIFDALVWVNYLIKKQDDHYLHEFLTLVNQDFILSNYLTTFYFYANTDTILNREFERQIEKKYGRIMNPDTINNYRTSYNDVKSKLEEWSNICEIDSTDLTIKETISLVFTELHLKITSANNVNRE